MCENKHSSILAPKWMKPTRRRGAYLGGVSVHFSENPNICVNGKQQGSEMRTAKKINNLIRAGVPCELAVKVVEKEFSLSKVK